MPLYNPPVASGGGAATDTVQPVTATGNVTAWGSIVLVSSATATTQTLPTALLADVGKQITVKNNSTGLVTIAAFGAESLIGQSTIPQFLTMTYKVVAVGVIHALPGIVGTPTLLRITGNTTVTATPNQLITYEADATSAPITITLSLAAQSTGMIVEVKKMNSNANAVTIARTGADTIDGAASFVINTQYQAREFKASAGNTFWGVY
jgi:hypothetical protein